MPIRALERLLLTERQRRRAAEGGGFSVPVLAEWQGEPGSGPYLVSNMRRQFLPTPGRADGQVRYAFSEVPLEDEDVMLVALHRALVEAGAVAATLPEALARLGPAARTVIVPLGGLPAMGATDTKEAQARMDRFGAAYEVGDVRVLIGGLPEGSAIVAAAPSSVGVYCRSSDALGLLIQGVGRTILAVPCPTSTPLSPSPTPSSTTPPGTALPAGGSATSKSPGTGSGSFGVRSRPFRASKPPRS